MTRPCVTKTLLLRLCSCLRRLALASVNLAVDLVFDFNNRKLLGRYIWLVAILGFQTSLVEFVRLWLLLWLSFAILGLQIGNDFVDVLRPFPPILVRN